MNSFKSVYFFLLSIILIFASCSSVKKCPLGTKLIDNQCAPVGIPLQQEKEFKIKN